ncbi:MAG: YcgL domain-containing protein [Pseudomonadota bacterium]
MLCHIYRSNRKLDTYLYLAEKDDFSQVPENLMRAFGPPEFSFSFDLTEQRKLALEDSVEVLKNLEEQGFHLQMQGDELVEQMLARKAIN